ncbi:subtilisin-like protease SBT1.9 [Abrus precatorius]|uniref:Subtilisin-like protease SBT1.9 n=1 Tax=Abrus precatorius TaxID=3816 RepID=A0A8B8K0R3_ABRPR|nr:subtilisin-like protease SBT1.9 [Abrus precatorius]
MATNISLCVCFSYIIVFHLISTLAQPDNYIIHMDISAMPKAFSSHHSWYESTLSTSLDNSQVTTNDNNHNTASSKLIYTYNNVMNGFSANLSPKELEALKSSLGYISSMPDLPAKLDTTHSPQFLGLNPNEGVWPASKFGEDVIVGLVDTGIWPESESFKDDGLTKIPSRWKGQCENSIQFNSSLCNNKLIGARFFNKGLLTKQTNQAKIVNSTRDTDGHGTHTSTTAAGSQVDNVSFFGYANGSAKGVASRARIAMYKAVWNEEAVSSDVIAAIDSAISDGVDVLSLSLGLNSLPLYNDPIAIATFAAIGKGIFVSTSAGNSGPLGGTLHNGIPWVTTVAASTLDREFHSTLTLGNGVNISGLSLYLGNFSALQVPIVFMGMCNNVKELVNVSSKIVVCEDKNGTIFDQVTYVQAAKVTGAVFISNSTDTSFNLQNTLASIIINQTNGEIVKAYISNSTDTKASMSFGITVLGTKPAPSVDIYSSRGPSNSCPFVLKPDITAPGTSILAAWPKNIPVSVYAPDKTFSNFNFLSGTSMACPHVAGVGALLKGAHPDWSPAAIRSAIMTTSDIFDNTKELIKDIARDYKPASPLALGAGHVNPNKALDPGLVYDLVVQDYVNLLCALNFTQKNITTITKSSLNNCSKLSLDLNYPSFIALYNGSSTESKIVQEFQRTVTNVGEGGTNYVASVTPIKGFQVTVIPDKLVFKEKNEKLSYKLRIEGPKIDGFGYLTWMDAKHVVRSPIVVTSIV